MTKDKIIKIQQKIDIKNQVFSDRTKLDCLSLGTEIIGRYSEAEKIINGIYDVTCPFISVYGRSGSGKSTLVRYVCDNLCDSLVSMFVNLRKTNTIFGCANLIASDLGLTSTKSYVGMSNTMTLIQNRIKEICSFQNKNRFILVLDEFDVIFSDTRHSPSDFIFRLIQLISDLRAEKIFFSIITISNVAISNYQIDDRVRSRIESNEMFFAPYKKGAIFSILSEIRNKSVKGNLSDDVLQKCAQISHDETGDCRRAIQLFKLAIDTANGNEVTIAHVDAAYNKLNSDRIDFALKNLTTHQKLILAAFSQLILYSENETQTTAKLYQEYSIDCSQNELKPLEYRRFSDILSDLENSGLVYGKNRWRGRYGLAKEFELCADFKLVGYRVNPDWWNQLYARKIREDQIEEGLHEIMLNRSKRQRSRSYA